ncbi:hypothetical protein CYMTET_33686 [Cymbomonas tetramitiformis]|uniref:DNA repair metallo-beta-lactamase domain-containing protein n=1 Tax=Cymbomonas tetramitiformis TaxID=36881 RepID=A0AAE0FD59_9CHLO|nr:hypothetical protein CYMTET_33686 [Cymbomonas tetramitiformis]
MADTAIWVNSGRKRTLSLCEWPALTTRLTTDLACTPLHVLPIGHINPKKLKEYLARFTPRFKNLVALRPTGWTFSEKAGNGLSNIKPTQADGVSIYGIPYSEHSSYNELKEFVRFLRPQRIVPTVNIGSATKRQEMEKHFHMWTHTS